jgi:hypothetical protein
LTLLSSYGVQVLQFWLGHITKLVNEYAALATPENRADAVNVALQAHTCCVAAIQALQAGILEAPASAGDGSKDCPQSPTECVAKLQQKVAARSTFVAVNVLESCLPRSRTIQGDVHKVLSGSVEAMLVGAWCCPHCMQLCICLR